MLRRISTLALALVALLVAADRSTGAAPPATTQAAAAPEGMVRIPGGTFNMGTADGFAFEGPVHPVTLKAYFLDKHEVTVAQFQRFVAATGYKTEAEKFGWSGVFDRKAGEWARVDGADWRRPCGPVAPAARADEPVVHVSYADAQAYAKWAGKRLPTEAEFEFAARGGLEGRKYAWGDDLQPAGKPLANIWQGTFPQKDDGADGHLGIAPVGSFPPNGYGLHDITGNVWEWCGDWFDPNYYARSPAANPTGPEAGQERVLRGGSWMCSENYCAGYRVAARSKTAPDSGLDNLGFRCAKDDEPATGGK